MYGLSGDHVMVVSKYFKTINDFINLELVCKKFRGNMEKFHFNPIPLNSKTFKYFPNIETLHLWDIDDEGFFDGFLINAKEKKKCGDKAVSKKKLCLIVWFEVDFETIDRIQSRKIKYQNVTYTQYNRKKYGNNIPSGVSSIDDMCFDGCSNLSSVIIPSSVTSIGNYCFYECSNLRSLTIPLGVISIGYNCFNKCSSLSSVIIPPSVTSLGEYCFGECSNICSVIIPSSVRSIGDYCFYKCKSLSSINISPIVTSIGDYCFDECSSLSSITIPSSVISINDNCFLSNTIVHQSK
ncbi:hypothetical protein EIN_339140 [Entamoeba invadens IP1]|uniref:Leucine rich repeat containing protein BspA family protein n=1 Tax=Entamoeba invadens IP1 TaxID=370355 RepID=A0A0A1UD59_ENTIV|nr:hypothetical protein EIN_339140 [Entamoeba invadens IP1]ELP90253.1 hypothetical protein EIN_339140 [Entamoeba invadens IP1]|eukprot:XP_004257024.1 hypothetical protein EIN_339140 [Entamoeba invadens IP1]